MLKDKLMPWRMAQQRKSWVSLITMPMRYNTALNNLWTSVMYPEPAGKK